MLRTVMSSIMRRRRGLNWAIGNSCLRDGLQHPHPLRQETLTKSRCARRGSGFVQSPLRVTLTELRYNGGKRAPVTNFASGQEALRVAEQDLRAGKMEASVVALTYAA